MTVFEAWDQLLGRVEAADGQRPSFSPCADIRLSDKNVYLQNMYIHTYKYKYVVSYRYQPNVRMTRAGRGTDKSGPLGLGLSETKWVRESGRMTRTSDVVRRLGRKY